MKRTRPFGPWDNEPDTKKWRNRNGLMCWIRRRSSGVLCGYVGVFNDSPLHGVDGIAARVHGGLSFAGLIEGCGDLWWFGFDCGHAGDVVPDLLWSTGDHGDLYRDFDFVRSEVDKLAEDVRFLELMKSSLQEGVSDGR